ncbi:hypothetical protein [Streptomyces qinglanensis]|uniref:DNA-directed RNA polymerase specialized sigma subunit, sigma24 family n=1 Tax=Streptomyces qinglanensis TaxID=943816 RepID=A0A1H9W7E3_9ACTN|nr:hypothetical protein SAMN05421870_115152 [Streptomyces qinglanensis]
MTSRREHPTNAPGAPPAHRAGRTTHHHAAHTVAGCDDADLNGLFTYCLSVLCEHESALAALGEALALADRRRARGRAPEGEHALRPWLYALARWVCARRLADQRAGEREEHGASAARECAAGPAVARRGAGTRAAGRPPAPAASPSVRAVRAVPPASPTAERAALLGDSRPGPAGHLPSSVRRHRELAALAWPEAAGISPGQREALELSVRHGLSAAQIAAVLSLSTAETEELLLNAACEVERTRAALHVVESGGCAVVARLAGDERLLLGTALRRELVEHVDDCPQCRRAAERAMAGVSWPGTAPASAALAVVAVPRPAVEAAVALARRARVQRTPRFDRAGYPQCENVRPARRDRLRSRALTSTVVAAVLAAPVVALWAAYRGAPVTGAPQADRSATAPDTADGSRAGGRDGGAGGPGTVAPPTGSRAWRAAPDGAAAGPAGRAAASRSHGMEPPVRGPGAPSAPRVGRPASEPAAAPHRSVPVSRPAAAAPDSAAASPSGGGAPSGGSPADSGPLSGSSAAASTATPSAAEPPPATSRPAFADIGPSGPPRAPSGSPS